MDRVGSPARESHDKAWAVGANADEPAGKAALPPAPLSLLARLTRREFLVLTGVAALASLPGCGSSGSSSPQPSTTRFAWRLSGRGRRTSQAAKSHNANWLYASPDTAEAHRAHPGDGSRVVRVDLSDAFHELLFAAGDLADLRRVLRR